MDCLFEGVLRKPGLIPGRKTKVWCILDGKELVFFRENKRSSCIGSEDLTEITSIQRIEGSDTCDFKIETETKSTVYSAENGTACEQWILHIKEALVILGINICTEKVKTSAKERIDIPKSPEKSVHSLMQLWQHGPNSPVTRNRKLEQRKPEHYSKNRIIENDFPVSHMKSGIDDTVHPPSQSKHPEELDDGDKTSRTDSGYETIPSEKRNSDHKLDTAPNDTDCTEADDILNVGDTNEVINDEKFPKENKEGNDKVDSDPQEPSPSHVSSQQAQPRQTVTLDINGQGTEEVDLSNVVLRRKSRPSVMDSSLSFDENSNKSGMYLTKSEIPNGHEASLKISEDEVFESDISKKVVENKGLRTTNDAENVTTETPEEDLDEPPVVLRKGSVANGVDILNQQTTAVTLSITTPDEEEEDVVDGEMKGDDLNVDDFEEFLNDLTFDPLPKLAPLTLEDISESLSGIADLIAEESSLKRSAIKSQNGDELAQLKEMLNST